MEANYIIILDSWAGEIIKIKLTEKEKHESEKYEDYNDFLKTLEDKYDFCIENCTWTTMENLSEKQFNF